jgi:hypothetical protein
MDRQSLGRALPFVRLDWLNARVLKLVDRRLDSGRSFRRWIASSPLTPLMVALVVKVADMLLSIGVPHVMCQYSVQCSRHNPSGI